MLKKLQEERQKLAVQIKAMNDKITAEGRDFTAEETVNWDKINADYDKNELVMQRFVRVAAVQKQVDEIQTRELPGRENQAGAKTEPNAFHQFLRFGKHGDSFEVLPTTPNSIASAEQFRDMAREVEKRNLATSTTTAPIGAQFQSSFEQAMLQFGNVRGVARILRTSSGELISWPTINDTGNAGALLAEATTFGNSVDPALAKVDFNAYKQSSTPIIVSSEMLEDSAYGMESVIGALLGERLARGLNASYTTANGSDKINGIVTAASTAGVTCASSSAFTIEELMDLQHSIDPAYRTSAAKWMMNDATAKALRKLKDGTSQYYWQPSLVAGQPDILLGYSVIINQNMASMGSATKPMLFGDFSKYMIREVNGIRLVKLTELYALTDQIAFVAYQRTDGDLLDAGTKPVKHMLMAT